MIDLSWGLSRLRTDVPVFFKDHSWQPLGAPGKSQSIGNSQLPATPPSYCVLHFLMGRGTLKLIHPHCVPLRRSHTQQLHRVSVGSTETACQQVPHVSKPYEIRTGSTQSYTHSQHRQLTCHLLAAPSNCKVRSEQFVDHPKTTHWEPHVRHSASSLKPTWAARAALSLPYKPRLCRTPCLTTRIPSLPGESISSARPDVIPVTRKRVRTCNRLAP